MLASGLQTRQHATTALAALHNARIAKLAQDGGVVSHLSPSQLDKTAAFGPLFPLVVSTLDEYPKQPVARDMNSIETIYTRSFSEIYLSDRTHQPPVDSDILTRDAERPDDAR